MTDPPRNLPALVLGTAQFDPRYGIPRASPPAVPTAILDAAVAAGVAGLDTAPSYGDAEEIIGAWRASHPSRDALELCTKLPSLRSGLSDAALSQGVTAALDGSRRRLRTDRIHRYLVHDVRTVREYGPRLMDVLRRAAENGTVGRFGASIYTAQDAADLLALDGASAVQFPFNAFDRRLVTSGRAVAFQRAGFATFARSILLQGTLADPSRTVPGWAEAAGLGKKGKGKREKEKGRRVGVRGTDTHAEPVPNPLEAFHEMARSSGTTSFRAALWYAAHRSGADFLVLGVETPGEMTEAAEAMHTPPPDGLLAAIHNRFDAVPDTIIDPRRWAAHASG